MSQNPQTIPMHAIAVLMHAEQLIIALGKESESIVIHTYENY